MIYEFTSRATAPVMMMDRDAEELLRIIGKAPDARGIVEEDEIPRVLALLRSAVALEHAEPAVRGSSGAGKEDEAWDQDDVTLRQRAWPLIEMLERSQAAGDDVTWSRTAA